MLGFRYIKVPPTTFVIQFVNGKVRREGTGLSFFYFAPGTTLVAVPAASTDAPFIFHESTADFQGVTVQGHMTFRIADPKKLATLLDYSIGPDSNYKSDDPTKLPDRVTQTAQTALRGEIQSRSLRKALVEADAIGQRVFASLQGSSVLEALGVEVLECAILAIKPVPETSKALEAQAREQLLLEADDAIYLRRNNAVEQERKIRENELNTEILEGAKQREIEENKLKGEILQEEKKQQLVTLEAANSKLRADAQSYAMEATLRPLSQLDPKALQILAAQSVDPRMMISMAFQELAANAQKIGNLNISPDLLDRLLHHEDR